MLKLKKWLCLLVVLMLAGCDSNQNIESEVPEKVAEKTHETIEISKEQIYEGNLLLVNKDNPIQDEGLPTDIVNLYENKELIKGTALLDNTVQLSMSVAERFGEMVEAASQTGVNHFMISSGYRDKTEQEKLYLEKGSDYALPAGYSEHNAGLSLDIGSTLKSIDVAPEGEWLKENAWDYGFILRYPANKTAITGIHYEPWHFRYVGLPHSMIMKEKQLTLEEYLDFLKEQTTFTTTIKGESYEISYIPVSEQTTIEVPIHSNYELSGNNVDGVILTIVKNQEEEHEEVVE